MKFIITLAILVTIILTMGFTIFNKGKKEEKFWNWFVVNQETYINGIENLEIRDKIFNELYENLQKVNSNLLFEFSRKDTDGIRELIISADGIYEIFPIVESLVEKAPTLKNWKFLAFRQRILEDDFVIQMGDTKISFSDIYYQSEDDNDKIGIKLYIRNYKDNDQTKQVIFLLLDRLVGEYKVATKIGEIEWFKLDENNKAHLKPFIELRKAVDNK